MKKLVLLALYCFISIFFLNAQHLKKNGTPDMRFKENKTSTTTTNPVYTPSSTTNTPSNTFVPSNSQVHLKKDGTPDKRFKENQDQNTTTSLKQTENSNQDPTVQRDKNGKITRSEAARREFMKQTGYPNGRPGYVIDHIKPLKKGGCDCPSNMQWQTIEEAKAKDKWE